MWFNSMQREEPYQGLTYWKSVEIRPSFGTKCTGGAWLSSARVVRCWVKSRNGATLSMLPASNVGDSRELPVTNRRKVGMMSSHHAPYVLGYTRATLAGTKGCKLARVSESQKAGRFG